MRTHVDILIGGSIFVLGRGHAICAPAPIGTVWFFRDVS